MYYYNNKPIEKINASLCDDPTKEIKNVLLNIPIHAIEYLDEESFNWSAQPNMNYNTDSLLLTDGEKSSENNWPNPQYFHIHNGGARAITFKLPCLCAVNGFSINFCRDDTVAVRIPRWLKIRVSDDGENFQTVYETNYTGSKRDKETLTIKQDFELIKAVYVQISFDVVHHVFIDEIEVYGRTDVTGARSPENDGTPLFYEFPKPKEYNAFPPADIIGAHNINLTYNYRPFQPDNGLQTEEDYLPLVGYLDKDGKILDTFMDGQLFLPDTDFVFNERGQNAAGWKEYIDATFTKDKNVDALNKAVGKVKDALNIPDYKISVYFSLLYTYTGYEQFGELDGEIIRFKDVESRKKAIKWMVDNVIRRYTEGNYSNTQLKGFYWFEEVINPSDPDEPALIKFAGDYVRSKGYKLFWIPYYKACGYEDWERYGLDTACMQPNYAFSDDVPKERLYENAYEAKRLGMCVELEVWKIREDEQGNIDNPQHIEKFMDYMYAGAETGSMMSCKMYYHGSAPGGCITNGWKSKNSRYREMYDTCYLFAKEKLKIRK